MTDRVNYLTVVVRGDLREDDALPLIAAISQFKDVISVGFDVADAASYVAEQRAKNALIAKIMEALK